MKFDKDVLIREGSKVGSFEELAEALGVVQGEIEGKMVRVLEKFVEKVSAVCPGIELLFQRYDAEQDLKAAIRSADHAARHEAKDRLMNLTMEILDADLGMDLALAVPGKKKGPKVPSLSAKTVKGGSAPKAKPIAKAVEAVIATKKEIQSNMECASIAGKKRPNLSDDEVAKLRKTLSACEESISCEVLREDVLGLSPDGVYRGRTRVCLLLRPGVFGEDVVVESSVRQVTLHKGILNHCTIDLAPSPYWAVLDAMSDLGKFTKDQVVAHAVMLHGMDRDKGKYGTLERYDSACSIAYDVLKTHHVHPRKKYAGMSHLVAGCSSLDGVKGTSEIRGRKSHETLEYFVEYKKKLALSRDGGNAMLES